MPPEAVTPLLNTFRGQHGSPLILQDDEFNEDYPLHFEGDVVARRREGSHQR